MPRRGTYRTERIDDKLCIELERRMELEHRRGSLNAYIEEILDKWVSGYLIESEAFKRELEEKIAGSKRVERIGPAKGVIEGHEGKRKAS